MGAFREVDLDASPHSSIPARCDGTGEVRQYGTDRWDRSWLFGDVEYIQHHNRKSTTVLFFTICSGTSCHGTFQSTFICTQRLTVPFEVVVMNRIQHICAPSGRAANLNLTKRLILRIPAVLMLAQPLIRLYIGMCQDYETPSAQHWLKYARIILPNTWLEGTTNYASLFWSTFIGACFTQCVSITARSLEHIPSAEDPSTFNLASFAFLLHVHSTNRAFLPNAHVYLIVISRVLELMGLSVLQCWRRPPVSRLVYTSALGVLMTMHYVYTMLYTNEYPTMHSTTRFLEASTAGIILLTLCLHGLTVFMTDGHVSVNRLVFTSANMPRSTDDYTIAVLKLGTACLHATRLTGFSLELKTLDMPLHTYVELHPDGQSVLQHGIADIEQMESDGINGYETEVKNVRVVMNEDPPELGSPVRGGDKLRECWSFVRALGQVVKHSLSAAALRLEPYCPPVPGFIHNLPRYVRLFWHGTNGEARREARLRAEREHTAELDRRNERLASLHERFLHRQIQKAPTGIHAPPAWLAIEDLDPLELISLAENEAEDLPMFQDVLLKHMLRPDHAPPLTRRKYRQLIHNESRASARDMALSDIDHSTKKNAWSSAAALLALPAGPDLATVQTASDRNTQLALLHLLQERRRMDASKNSRPDHERSRLCVVCCCEERCVRVICNNPTNMYRTVINWPCRCLALCNACREILANQQKIILSHGQNRARTVQLCPTCRTPVLAFSRLYLP